MRTLSLWVGIASVLFAGEPPAAIRMPPLTTAPATPTKITKLTAATQFIIDSDAPLLVFGSPEGVVKIVEERGPLRVRGLFADQPEKLQTRTFTGKHLYAVEPLATGKVELFVQPVGATSVKQILRRTLEVDLGPKPPPKPDPTPSPVPIAADGLHVLIVYETADAPKATPAQLDAIYSLEVRNYLDARCPKGPDGKTGQWRMWDQHADVSAESKLWQDALRRPRSSLPWIIVSNGKAGHEGPLPATTTDLMTLLKQYGG